MTKRLSVEEFTASLKKKGRVRDSFADSITAYYEGGGLLIARKGRDLVEVMKEFAAENKYPIIDKQLNMVFGVRTHGIPRAMLYWYHSDLRMFATPSAEAADMWTFKGMGYYVSSMLPNHVVLSGSYRGDRFDKDVFQIFHKTGSI